MTPVKATLLTNWYLVDLDWMTMAFNS